MSEGEIHPYPALTRAVMDMLAARDDPMSRYTVELIRLGAEAGKAAADVMRHLEEHGPAIVPHLLDTDENAGQRLRDTIAKLTAAGLKF